MGVCVGDGGGVGVKTVYRRSEHEVYSVSLEKVGINISMQIFGVLLLTWKAEELPTSTINYYI